MTEQTNPTSYATLTATWLALLALTGVTVWTATHPLGVWRVWVALAIASVKGGLVIAIFMQLKYEGRLLRLLLFLALATLTIFIGLTFVDVRYR